MKKNKIIITISVVLLAIVVGISCTVIFSNIKSSNAYTDNWTSYRSYYVGEKDSDGYYKITTPNQLAQISYSNTSYQNAKIRLYADIDFAGKNWTPIGNGSTPFKGVFDGQNYTISNMLVPNTYEYAGLFGNISEAEISNIIFKNCSVSSYRYSGMVSGYAYDATINNVLVGSSSCLSQYQTGKRADLYCGGICGNVSNTSIQKCFVNGTRVNAYSASTDENYNLWAYAGGIVGYAYSSDISLSYFSANGRYLQENTYNYANIVYCGGIVGYGVDTTVSKCYNTSGMYGTADKYGNYSKPSSYTGGIIGKASSCTVKYCFNRGDVKGYASGYVDSYTKKSLDYNKYVGTSYVKDVNGTLTGGWDLYMAYGDARFEGYGGDYGTTLKVWEYEDTIYNAYAGGIVGYSDSGKIYQSYNTGSVSANGPDTRKANIYFKWAGIKHGAGGNQCNLLLQIVIKYAYQYKIGNVVGYYNNLYYYSNYYENAITIKQTPNITQTYIVNGKTYSDHVAQLTKWNDTYAYSTKDSNWYLKSYNGKAYYTYFDIDASNPNYIYFNALYSDGSDSGTKTQYGYFSTGINYSPASDGSATLSERGSTGISVGSSKLSSTVWATNANINNGYPYIKQLYW